MHLLAVVINSNAADKRGGLTGAAAPPGALLLRETPLAAFPSSSSDRRHKPKLDIVPASLCLISRVFYFVEVECLALTDGLAHIVILPGRAGITSSIWDSAHLSKVIKGLLVTISYEIQHLDEKCIKYI